MITIQYLEDNPDLKRFSEPAIIERLRDAYERLPFTHLLIGWNVPASLLDRCHNEAQSLGIRFLRWQPLLAGDRAINFFPSMRVKNASLASIARTTQLPAFNFVCPNHPEVQQALLQYIEEVARQGLYDGFFLDRVRFPSPSVDPLNGLCCFCEHCRRKAANDGLDLDAVRALVVEHAGHEGGRITLVQVLLGGRAGVEDTVLGDALHAFLQFRQRSVLELAASVSTLLRQAHMEIGLDCFSPSLSIMVGQDLASCSALADWIKLMTYAHTLAPAGIPYELLGFYDYLSTTTHLKPADVIQVISSALGLTLPSRRSSLQRGGLSPAGLQQELLRGVEQCAVPVLAGLELVDLAGVTQLNPRRIKEDLAALRLAKVAGLSISWDLLHIPLPRLGMVRRAYL